MSCLQGVSIVETGVNVPGPVACARLLELGARVVKVEPRGGDPLARYAPAWYEEISRGKHVVPLDLKSDSGRRRMEKLLGQADLLVTSSRLGSLEALGLGWARLQEINSRLSQIAIVGFRPPRQERAGHDLTYLAPTGLLSPPVLPTTIAVDLLGAERAVSEALVCLISGRNDGRGRFRQVALGGIAKILGQPLLHGLTDGAGVLGGGFPRYGFYRARDGWIALAALEEGLWNALVESCDRPELLVLEGDALRRELSRLFAERTCSDWAEIAERAGLPLEIVA